ncbi:acyl-CoA-binding protein-like isoform X3 [Eleutherodactylus coqui]|uniref:acyl-CoA-binding protein-like isoform X3 n=1 Tax=Eleutherodactylus coqui TaxID=57060 RepID=UPI003461947B
MSKAQMEWAKNILKHLKCLPPEKVKVRIYALYQQATVGDINTDRPINDLIKQLQHDAWAELKGTSKSDAGEKYIELAEELRLKDCKP